jgi:hypothetical protein
LNKTYILTFYLSADEELTEEQMEELEDLARGEFTRIEFQGEDDEPVNSLYLDNIELEESELAN